MSQGITAELSELIALKYLARSAQYKPEQRAQKSGNHVSKRRGRGMDFAEVRNYQSGDEIRHMEWRITARTGKPHTKLYQEERERPVVLMTDFNSSMYFGTRKAFKSVMAAHLAAMIAWTAIKQGDWVGGVFFSETEHSEYAPRARDAGVLPLLAALKEYTHKRFNHYKESRSFLHALQRLTRVARPGSIIVIISDFYQFTSECAQLLARLNAHCEVMAYHICDPLELSPPQPQQYAITNGQNEVLLDTTNRLVTQAYQHYIDERMAHLKKHFKQLQIPFIQVTAENDIPRLVHETFPGRKYAQ